MNILLRKNKKIVILVLLFSILCCGVTLAYLNSSTQDLSNTFTLKDIDTEIQEEPVEIDSDIINKSPKVFNNSQYSCIVRVKIIVSPEDMIKIGTDDNCNIIINSDWYQDGEYYYYSKVLNGNTDTSPVFTKITGVVETTNDGKSQFIEGFDNFEVTIYQEAVQTQIGDTNMGNNYDREKAKIIWNYYDTHGGQNS